MAKTTDDIVTNVKLPAALLQIGVTLMQIIVVETAKEMNPAITFAAALQFMRSS